MERINPHNSNLSPLQKLIILRHQIVYQFATSLANQLKVLDLGCGVGYGSLMLAQTAQSVIGLDISYLTLPTNNPSSNVNFSCSQSENLPLANNSVNLVVSLQVIEHIQNDKRYLTEINRVLTQGGCLLVSTPNKATRLYPFQQPTNPYHVREYNYYEFKKLLEQYFGRVEIKGLQASPEIMAIERRRFTKNPLRIYGEMLLPSLITKKLKTVIEKKLPPKSNENHFLNTPFNYTLQDFWLDNHNITTSLDLIGICYK